MTAMTPRLVLSTDYELFFDQSGSVQRCLLDPAERLLEFAARYDARMTFFVDTGMLRCFDRYAGTHRTLGKEIDAVRRQLRQIAAAGHELGLHIHPHWEDTRFADGAWDFRDTRYKLDLFTDAEIDELLHENARLLQELSDEPIVSYRAGGFCVEPFERIAPVLADLGISIDSSVVPAARLDDEAKGFDFSAIPDDPYWEFETSPAIKTAGGRFREVAVTSLRLNRLYFWGRLVQRLRRRPEGGQYGDGRSKAIGKGEVIRRLLGASLVSELSMDHGKAPLLQREANRQRDRAVWHVMGHPKLLSERSLEFLGAFIEATGSRPGESVAGFADSQ